MDHRMQVYSRTDSSIIRLGAVEEGDELVCILALDLSGIEVLRVRR